MKTGKKFTLTQTHCVLLSFFILGMLNVIVLPTATWGHSYFLYYFLPFFASVQALVLVKTIQKPVLFYGILIFICISSGTVQYWKMEQVKKQYWKFTLAQKIEQKLYSYETISLINYPGDVFENYYLHPVKMLFLPSWRQWFESKDGSRYLLITCTDTCTEGESAEIERIRASVGVTDYTIEENLAWLAERGTPAGLGASSADIITTKKTGNIKSSSVVRLYRVIRDFLQIGQL